MAFDEGLAERIRDIVDGDADVTERRMFGGLAFMVRSHMLVAVIGETLVVRTGPDLHRDALAFTGRNMGGFVTVEPSGFDDDASLRDWILLARTHIATLSPHGTRKARRRSDPV
ncbi:MAG: TfoX family protein [Proteobacteria bacterium]|nr:TfoX family protein [Pseudomonadota bacterium]